MGRGEEGGGSENVVNLVRTSNNLFRKISVMFAHNKHVRSYETTTRKQQRNKAATKYFTKSRHYIQSLKPGCLNQQPTQNSVTLKHLKKNVQCHGCTPRKSTAPAVRTPLTPHRSENKKKPARPSRVRPQSSRWRDAHNSAHNAGPTDRRRLENNRVYLADLSSKRAKRERTKKAPQQ